MRFCHAARAKRHFHIYHIPEHSSNDGGKSWGRLRYPRAFVVGSYSLAIRKRSDQETRTVLHRGWKSLRCRKEIANQLFWPVELTLKKSQFKHSVLFAGSLGMNFPLSSARYSRMLPDSKILRYASYVHRTSREAAVVGKNWIVIRLIFLMMDKFLVPECLSTSFSPSSPTDAVPRDFDAIDIETLPTTHAGSEVPIISKKLFHLVGCTAHGDAYKNQHIPNTKVYIYS